MKITDVLMKVLKIGFSLINAILAFAALFLLFETLRRIFNEPTNIIGIALPLYLFLIFSFNVITNWKQFPVSVSAIQIIATIIPTLILIIIAPVVIPMILAISSEVVSSLGYTIEESSLKREADSIMSWVDSIIYLLIASCFNIAAQAFYDRKTRKN